MVVNDCDFKRIASSPAEADAPLIVDPDAMLALSVAFQSFESVSRWDAKVVQSAGAMNLNQLHSRLALQVVRQPLVFTPTLE